MEKPEEDKGLNPSRIQVSGGRQRMLGGNREKVRGGQQEEGALDLPVAAAGRLEKKGRCWEWKAEWAFMQCVLSDKETINGAEPAKGIKSTHARPLFKLIKGPPFFFGEARFTHTTKAAD